MKDLVGKRFGELLVIGEGIPHIRESGAMTRKWRCLCDCDNIIDVFPDSLIGNRTVSCGCSRYLRMAEKITTHGATKNHSQTGEYGIWLGIKSRCKHKQIGYADISVCERWTCKEGFSNFLTDMGPRPSKKHSIDRIDNKGHYCPENCRWATIAVQARNKSTTKLITFNNKTQCITDWGIELGISNKIISKRLKDEWTVEEALTTPVNTRKSKPFGGSINV